MSFWLGVLLHRNVSLVLVSHDTGDLHPDQKQNRHCARQTAVQETRLKQQQKKNMNETERDSVLVQTSSCDLFRALKGT